MIGFAVCGSFCTHGAAIEALSRLVDAGRDVLPIVSFAASTTDTRFGRADALLGKLESVTGHAPVLTIRDAEPLGPARPLEALVVCPCTGNTLAKLAHSVTDTPVTMACKAHLRCDRPLLLALATNDALAGNLSNIGEMCVRKHVYFVPMRQDDVAKKPHSLVAEFSLLPDALDAAMEERQLRPLFL